MVAERPAFGWHAALIVSISGFKTFKKYTSQQLELLGRELKDKSHIMSWLNGYQPLRSGLWVPARHASAIPEFPPFD